MAKPPMPARPAADATEAERAQWREDMHLWLNKHRGVELDAKGLEQERELVDFMSRSPAEQEQSLRAKTERMRNLMAGTSSSGMKTVTSYDRLRAAPPQELKSFARR